MIKSLKHHKTSSSLVVRCTAFKKDMSPRFPQAPLILLTNKMWLLKPPPPFHLLLLPPYAFVFSFVLLKRINILEGIFPSARLSFYHLPLRETQNASVLRFFFFFLLEEEQLFLGVKWASTFSVKFNPVAHIGKCSQSSQQFVYQRYTNVPELTFVNGLLMLKCCTEWDAWLSKHTDTRWQKQFCLGCFHGSTLRQPDLCCKEVKLGTYWL